MDANEKGRTNKRDEERGRRSKSVMENVLVALGCPHKLVVLPSGQFVLSFIEPPLT